MSLLTDDELLDLEGGRRAATFRFDLLDATGALLGELDVFADEPPVITNNTNRRIKRQLENLQIEPSAYADVNAVTDRLRPSMILENGSEFPLGIFLFADVSQERSLARLMPTAKLLVGQSIIIDQPIEEGIGYSPGKSITAAIGEQFDAAGVSGYSIDASGRSIAAPIAWPAGTIRATILAELAGMMGAYSPYFDNSGQARVKLIPDLDTAAPDLTYEIGGRIFDGTIVETDDLLEAPNRYIVIDSSLTDSPITGSFDVPDDAPHSIAKRGFVVATVIDVQGLENAAAADDRARAAYAQDSSTFLWASFSGPPDPRHDTFQIVRYNGLNWREQAWSMTLAEGAPMGHSLRRIFENTVA